MVVPRDTKRDERVQIRWYHWLWHAPKVRVRDLNWPAAPVVRRIIDRFVAQGATRVQVVRGRINVYMIVLNGFDVRVHGRPRPAGVPERGPRVVLRFRRAEEREVSSEGQRGLREESYRTKNIPFTRLVPPRAFPRGSGTL